MGSGFIVFCYIIAFVVGIVGSVFIGKMAAKVAEHKGYASEANYWFWMGLFFTTLTLLALIAVPNKNKNEVKNLESKAEIVNVKPEVKQDVQNKSEIEADNVVKVITEDSVFNAIEELSQKLEKGEITKEEFEKAKQFIFNKTITK